jgi:hypothetical protein
VITTPLGTQRLTAVRDACLGRRAEPPSTLDLSAHKLFETYVEHRSDHCPPTHSSGGPSGAPGRPRSTIRSSSDELVTAIVTCPGCQCRLVVSHGVSSVTCGECGQAIAPVFQESSPLGVGMSQQQPLGAVAGASHPEPAPPHPPANPSATLDSSSGFLVKCPLCAALLQPPQDSSLAVCGGCHQVIALPGAPASADATPPVIACPSCSRRVQPPPGAPLVSCGACRQVMRVPGYEGM